MSCDDPVCATQAVLSRGWSNTIISDHAAEQTLSFY